MMTSSLPERAVGPTSEYLDRYFRGIGRIRLLTENTDATRLSAKAVLAEANLSLRDVNKYLDAQAPLFDSFFNRLRLLLLDGNEPIGSVVLENRGEDWLLGPVILGGVQDLVSAIADAEGLPESDSCEVRIVSVARIYLEALVLVRHSGPIAYYTVTPPYSEWERPLNPEDFASFVRRLIVEHRDVFPRAETGGRGR